MNHLVISFITDDRPGLVDTLSNVVKQHHGNWQTSSMHHLSGYFAGVIELAVAEQHCPALISALNNLADFKINIEQSSSDNISALTPKIILELTANDREGIVQEISSVIHHQGGNLVKLVSSQEQAAHSGQPLFKAKVTLTVSEDEIDNLVDSLENLADDLMVDISR